MEKKKAKEDGCVVFCGGKGCRKAGGDRVRKELEKLAEKEKVRLTVAETDDCMGKCAQGPVAIVWPAGKCCAELSKKDAADLLELAAAKKGE